MPSPTPKLPTLTLAKKLRKTRGHRQCQPIGPSALGPSALCAESEVRKAVERSSYAVALKFRVFFLFLKSVKF